MNYVENERTKQKKFNLYNSLVKEVSENVVHGIK